MNPQKPFSPAAQRNCHAIAQALSAELNLEEHVFEFGSGSGQHICHFAKQYPGSTWQPSDLKHQLPGIQLWIEESGCTNILPPIAMDLADDIRPDLKATLCYSANTLHIVSFSLVQQLFLHAAAQLSDGGKLCVYGPFRFDGVYTSDGNRQFDRQLRERDPASGLREFNELNEFGMRQGFAHARVIDMPANNHFLIWDRE